MKSTVIITACSLVDLDPPNLHEWSENLGKENYHVDHIFSIRAGYLAGVDPLIISHYTNLRVIEKFDNLSKSFKCDKDINSLYCDYYLSKEVKL